MRELLLADPSHCEAIANIYNGYLGNGTMELSPKSAAYYEGWIMSAHDNEELWVLLLDQVLIGYGLIKRYSEREGYRLTGETSVYLHPDHIGQGHGSYIKRHILQRCRDLGYHHLVAKIWTRNEASIAYNLKLGYEIVGVQREVGYVNGEWIDGTIMQLIL